MPRGGRRCGLSLRFRARLRDKHFFGFALRRYQQLTRPVSFSPVQKLEGVGDAVEKAQVHFFIAVHKNPPF